MNPQASVYGLMLAFTLAAAVTDLWKQKIYNALVYPGIVVGLLANTLVPEGPTWQDALLGFLVCGGVMFVAFPFFDIGGGDVKLLAMMGAFLGLSRGIEGLLWTLVIGMVIGVSLLIWRVGAVELIRRVIRHVSVVIRYRTLVPPEKDEREHLKAPLGLAPAAVLAELIVVTDVMNRFG